MGRCCRVLLLLCFRALPLIYPHVLGLLSVPICATILSPATSWRLLCCDGLLRVVRQQDNQASSGEPVRGSDAGWNNVGSEWKNTWT